VDYSAFFNTAFGKFLIDLQRFKLKTLNLNGTMVESGSSQLHNGSRRFFLLHGFCVRGSFLQKKTWELSLFPK